MLHSYIPGQKSRKNFRNISTERKGLDRTQEITHRIDTGNAEPIRQRYYQMSPNKKKSH